MATLKVQTYISVGLNLKELKILVLIMRLGLFTGCSIALVVAIIVSLHGRALLDKDERNRYMEAIFPLYRYLLVTHKHYVAKVWKGIIIISTYAACSDLLCCTCSCTGQTHIYGSDIV